MLCAFDAFLYIRLCHKHVNLRQRICKQTTKYLQTIRTKEKLYSYSLLLIQPLPKYTIDPYSRFPYKL